MNCPACGKEMTRGAAQIRGTLAAFFVVGISHEHLFFRGPDPDQKDVPLLKSRQWVDASRCADCGLLLLTTNEEKYK